MLAPNSLCKLAMKLGPWDAPWEPWSLPGTFLCIKSMTALTFITEEGNNPINKFA